jgi:hypothetical protein
MPMIKPLLVGSLTGVILASPVAASQGTLIDAYPFGVSVPAFNSQAAPQPETLQKTEEPAWLSHLTKNAQALSDLRAGWDGSGSIPISRKVLYRATRCVELALKSFSDLTPPRLVPGGDGTVQIEWHAKHGELEFDIGPQEEMTIWIRDRRNGAEFKGENQAALALFYRWAPWIASQQRHVPNDATQAQMPLFSIAA